MVEAILKKIGLKESEIKIFTFLNKTGPTGVAGISSQLNIPRTTAKENLQSLMQKGLVFLTADDKKKIYVPEKPDKLLHIYEEGLLGLEQRLNMFKTLKVDIDNVVNGLSSDRNTALSKEVSIRVYESKRAIAHLYDDILTSDEIRTYYKENEISNAFPENTDKFVKALRSGSVEIWNIFCKSQSPSMFKDRYPDIKNYYEKSIDLDPASGAIDYLIYRDSIAIVQVEDNPKAIVIQSGLLAYNARSLHIALWDRI